MTEDRKGYPQRVLGSVDKDGKPYEASRKRISAAETDESPVNVQVYFVLPADLDPKTCELRYE